MNVYKYRGGSDEVLRRDLKTLSKDQIYSAPLDTLNDPFEAYVKINNDSFRVGKLLSFLLNKTKVPNLNDYENGLIKLISGFIKESKSWGIYSLSKSYQDELLWAYYADSYKGICIEYDLDMLLEYKLLQEQTVEVKYQQEVPVVTINDILTLQENTQATQKLLGTKSIRWVHEGEIRIITATTGLKDFDFRAVKSIYFGYKSDPPYRKLVMRVMRGRKIKYFLISPKNGEYSLSKTPLEDTYQQKAKKYKERIAPVEAGLPLVDDNIKPHIELIKKAIEIVRREPYCEKVLDAYISGEKGTKDNPVFFVSYTASDGLGRKKYLSKKEIEDHKLNFK